MNEFALIKEFFSRSPRAGNRVVLGVGDDAALLRVAAKHELVACCDTMVVGRHFFADVDAAKLGYKALAVNLSDIAAMGAVPRWALLALTLPVADEAWLTKFSEGFFALADRYGVDLVGGDTTRGAYTITVQLLGEVPQGGALRRDGARVGDQVWVSGTLGDARLGLAHLRRDVALTPADASACLARLETPEPRVVLGEALRGIASSAIDISDGLVGDLGHILERSGVGARIELARLPRSVALQRCANSPLQLQALLGGGDDYELCFCAPKDKQNEIRQLEQKLDLRLTAIGEISAQPGLVVTDEQGQALSLTSTGFDHFAQP